MQAEGAAEKTCQARFDQLSPNLSKKRIHSLQEDLPAGQFASGEQLTDEEVVESAHTEQVHLAQLSHSPSRKRARLSQFAPGALPLTALEEEDSPNIDFLDGLPQHAEAVAMTPVRYEKSKRKKSSKLVKCLYEQDRSASDERFWSIEHMVLYNNIFSKKQCADNKWIDWKTIRDLPAMPYVEEACRDVGLHELMAIKQNWHEELIKQFYSTLSINESRTSLTWMTGRNKKITVTKRFCQKVLLVPSEHVTKIKHLTDAQEEELKSADGNQVNSLNRIIRKTIHPVIGDKGSMHALIRALEYHILFKKPFDIVDMMFEEMGNNHRHCTKRMPYAPYIMLLINSATKNKFVPESGGNECVEHKKYKMEFSLDKQPKDHRASKSKSMCVPSKKSKSMRVPKMKS